MMNHMTFCDNVYQFIRKIPAGKVATYGQVAAGAGNAKAARAAGLCLKKNPDAPRTPCHRVVAADGKLTGYSAAGGLLAKKDLLLAEGVFFLRDNVDLARSQWSEHDAN